MTNVHCTNNSNSTVCVHFTP